MSNPVMIRIFFVTFIAVVGLKIAAKDIFDFLIPTEGDSSQVSKTDLYLTAVIVSTVRVICCWVEERKKKKAEVAN